jgi:hypothetical protein
MEKKFYGTTCHMNFMAAAWIACHVESKSFLSWLTYLPKFWLIFFSPPGSCLHQLGDHGESRRRAVGVRASLREVVYEIIN